MKKYFRQLLIYLGFISFCLVPGILDAQPPGLTVSKGVGVQDLNGGIAVFGDPLSFHIAIDGDDIQAKTSNSASNGRLDLNFYGGDVRIGGLANNFYFKHNSGLGLGTDNPAGPIHVDFGATGGIFAGTPGGNGPGWITNAPDGDRWDLFTWNGGYQIRRHSTDNFFQFSDDGNLGIGTETPDGPLDIDFGATGSVVGGTPSGSGPGWIYNAANGNRWDAFASNNGFLIQRNGTNSSLTLDNDGKLAVKLGVVGAASDLHVKQTAGNSYSINGLRLEYGTNSNHWNTFIDIANDYDLAYNGVLKAWISEIDGAYNQPSDRRLKQGINKIPEVLERVLELEPVTYQYKAQSADSHTSWGFIAQDVKTLFPDFVTEKNGFMGLAYDNFAVLSIKAVQEMNSIIDQQQSEVNDLKRELRILKTQMTEILTRLAETPTENNYELSLEQSARLSQNQPNPFQQNTFIEFFIPEGTQSAQLRISNMEGKMLKEVNITQQGAGRIQIHANTYPAGTYAYSLILDGIIYETKKMVLTQ